ncbi:MAG: head GIN domain-containing protein [Parvularculaceae bacterium]
MKFFLGLMVGVFVAILIGVAAITVAFGSIDDINFSDDDDSAKISKTYELTDFDRIDIAGVYDLDVSVGGAFSVEISGPEDEMARVYARVEGGELILDQTKRENGKRNWRKRGLDARITLPALSAISVSGVVDGGVVGVAAEQFRVDLSGVGDLDLSGECGDLTANVSGVGDLNAEELKCKNVDVDVSGVGEASVYASESVDASISGIGEIEVYGSPPTVEKSGGFLSRIDVK